LDDILFERVFSGGDLFNSKSKEGWREKGERIREKLKQFFREKKNIIC
jgi:hypothetical protein